MERVPLEKVEQVLKSKEGWSIQEEKWLHKKYRFKKFIDAISFVNKIADLSEEVNHHPFISIDYVLVTIKLSSWKARGITDLDLKLIDQYDQLFNSLQS